MMHRFAAPAIALACLGISPALSQENLAVRCDLNSKPDRIISQSMFLGMKPGARTAVVSDKITLVYLEAPVTAKVVSNNGGKLVLEWEIPTYVSASNVRGKLRYRAIYRPDQRRIRVTVRAPGFVGSMSGNGACVPVDNAKLPSVLR